MADLFIGKPGGLTTAEAVASGLPMCVFNPIPGQEERNCDHLLEEGIAIKCNDLITLPYKITKLLDDPARMAQMKRQALSFAKPDAAQTVVRTLIEDRLQPLSLSRKQRLGDAGNHPEPMRSRKHSRLPVGGGDVGLSVRRRL